MRVLIVTLGAMLWGGAALAADPTATYSTHFGICAAAGDVVTERQAISLAASHYEIAEQAVSDQRALYSTRQVFPWALETRFACGQALGYLKGGALDVQSLRDCDCFYNQMMSAR